MQTLTPAKAFTQVKKAAEQIRNDQQQSVGTVSAGDVIRQGDLYLVAVPGLKLEALGMPITERQLAPGTTQGSRHVIEGPAELFSPNADRNGIAIVIGNLVKGAALAPELIGPVVRTGEGCVLAHPEHGNFELPARETFAVVYQRAFAEEVRRQLD